MKAQLLVSLVPVLLAGCYSPDLGTEPFECGDADPVCPDGYACVAGADGTKSLCEKMTGGGSGGFQCADDSAIEPNNSFEQPTPTPVASSRSSISFAGLAICPAGDIDVFEVTTTQASSTLTATLTYVAGNPALTVNILDTSGTTLGSGAAANPANVVVATHTLPNSGANYYVSVQAASGGENNYSLEIAVSQ